MKYDTGMFQSAKTLARNPLGIIALFIVLVYAVASIVITFAKPVFYHNPFHPAVLFLAVFPIVVLGAFTYLVAERHMNLYAPQDYKDQANLWEKALESPPRTLMEPNQAQLLLLRLRPHTRSLLTLDSFSSTKRNSSHRGLLPGLAGTGSEFGLSLWTKKLTLCRASNP
jgi:hypothetical protein